MKFLATLLLCLFLATPCYAVETDKVAHFALSYTINDQLQRKAGFNRFWAGFTTLAIGAVKEGIVDSHWDSKDFGANCMGVFFYQVTF